MEIVKKERVSINGASEEVEAVIDTGAERTMIQEETLLRIGAPKFGDIFMQTAEEFQDKKSMYGVMVEIDGCTFPVWVIGGRKNLIGHDYLQQAKAVIDEGNGAVKLTKHWVDM